MERRLVKIAKELNVGLSTLVDFLHGKGHDIDPKPTAKVSEGMYQELVTEFQKSFAIKEQADQMIIGTRPGTKKEQEAPSAPAPAPPPAPKPQPKPVEAVPAPPPPPVVETPPPPVIEKPVEEEIVAPPPIVKEPVEEEIVAPPPAVETPVVETPVVETPVTKAEEEPPVIVEAPKEKPAEPVITTTKAPGLKVLGKIDLSPKPKQGKKKGKKEEKEKAPEVVQKTEHKKPEVKKEEVATVAPKEQEKPTVAPATESKEATSTEEAKPASNEMIRAKTPELRGLKILGKIDTSKLDKPKSKSKKDKGKAAPGGDNKSKTGATDEPKKRKRRRRKVSGDTNQGGGNNSGGRSGGRSGGNSRGRTGGRRDEVKEVSKKEIEDKIKATMARMSGGGKKRRQKIRRDNRDRLREKQEQLDQEAVSQNLQVTEFISVQELANLMDVAVTDVIMTCMNLGVIVSINQRLDAEVIELVADEFGHEVEFISTEEEGEEEEEIIDDPEDLLPRAPIVTIMGHVDHGKTSLLDYVREANVADGEAGGITQHIGAYEVNVGGDKDKRVTFLDTPGHEAFTAMRARGAKVTDIAVIIIAADDNIMPQTKEAISHAEAAGVPIVFAINKIDKAGANPERIKQELASMNYLVEEWGGKYGSADISAKTGDGIDVLLERIQLEAEMKELTANPDRNAIGAILEASLDKGRGYVAKMLVQTGSLEVGESIVAGEYSGRVKAMFNERGKRVKKAGPSTPVLVLGLGGAPQAGEKFKVVESEQEAKSIATRRAQILREQANRATKRISLDEIGRRLALGNFKELNLIVKGDVDGSVEALSDSLIKLSQETVQVNVIHRAVGQIIESDALLASASDAIVIGFQVRPSAGARKLAEREGVQIKTYSIIYEAIEEIKLAIEGMLETIKEENILGQIDVKEIFKISKVGTVAGCFVSEGKILRESHVRLIRDGIVVYPTKEGQIGEIKALKRFKDEVKEVRAGMECGVSIKNYNDIKAGDIIEAYEIIEIKQKLNLK